jgi:hypothetical protein
MNTSMKAHAERVLAEQARLSASRDSDAVDTTTPEEAEALASVATEAAEMEQIVDEAVVGISYPTALTMKSFLPPGDPAFLARTMAGQPRGAVHLNLGRIRGKVRKAVPRSTMWEGKEIASIELQGEFTALVTETGQLLASGVLFLSRGFAASIANALTDGAVVDVDVDVGCESTGKTIAYTWTVTHYLSGVATRALRELQAPRRVVGTKPQPLLTAAE